MKETLALKDIKDIVVVPDYSLYILIGIVGLVLLIIVLLLYKYFTRIKKTKQLNAKAIALKKLKALKFTKDNTKDNTKENTNENTKDIAYTFSTDGYLFVDEKNRKEFERIEQALEKFKYKKDVLLLPQELQQEIKKFIKGLK